MFEDIKRYLLITDMDGTFLPSSKIPGKKTLEAVNRFQQAGGRFSIATGRACRRHSSILTALASTVR